MKREDLLPFIGKRVKIVFKMPTWSGFRYVGRFGFSNFYPNKYFMIEHENGAHIEYVTLQASYIKKIEVLK